jgi:Holliday junction resolvase RusA-like endonuclease
MPTMIQFEVLGIPKPQPRARSFVLRGKGGKPILSKTGQPILRVHEAGTAEQWKSQVAEAAKPYVPFPPLSDPIRMDIEFRLPRPKAHYRSNGELKPNAPIWHTGRGDIDNLFKAVSDALTVIGMYLDDGQVCVGHIWKIYTTLDRPAGAFITIVPLEFSIPESETSEPEKQEALL